jgi:sulfhydrogenase subunit beta (sulfur reductase)
MKVIRIDKSQWSGGLANLRKEMRLIGPAEEKGAHSFQELAPGQDPDLDFRNSRLSPKSLVFPQSEAMLKFSLDKDDPECAIMKDVARDYAPRAVIGVRPCDAKALALVSMNFDTEEYKDPYWLNLYNATTFVGLACDAPCSTCFCTTAGCGPYHEEGLDVLLVDRKDHYLARPLTEKGARLLAAAGWTGETDGAEIIARARQAAEAGIVSTIATENLRGADTMALYNAGFWDDVSFACINCGTCTFTCPTCWCFDIQDEVYRTKGVRMRNWDSCMFPIFTVHTTGHNPRDTKMHRARQRFMHKLKYFVDKYDQGIMCVGCGRCVRQCPVNIDIRRVSTLMNDLGAQARCAVQGR